MLNSYYDVCQCPVSGESHFYRIKEEPLEDWAKKCQCPVSGESHFYRLEQNKQQYRLLYCVNALSRANPISTTQ